MKGTESHGVERKVIAILRIIHESVEPVGARLVSRQLARYGIDLTERAVRYHLKIMDEKGRTQLAGRRDGRVITELGHAELKRALVTDKVGFAFSRIEMLTFQTTFDWNNRTGSITG